MENKFNIIAIIIFVLIICYVVFDYLFTSNFVFIKNARVSGICSENEQVIIFDDTYIRNPSAIKYFKQILGINDLSLPNQTKTICLTNNPILKPLQILGLNCNIPIPENVNAVEYCSKFNTTDKTFIPDKFNKVCSFNGICENVINSLTINDKFNDVNITQTAINKLKDKTNKNSCISIKNQWNEQAQKLFDKKYETYFDPENGYLKLNTIQELVDNFDIMNKTKMDEISFVSTKLNVLLNSPLLAKYEEAFNRDIVAKTEIQKSSSSYLFIMFVIFVIIVFGFLFYKKKFIIDYLKNKKILKR